MASDIGYGIRTTNVNVSTLDSFILGVILLGVVFLVGTVVEVVSDVFVRRTFSILVKRFTTIPRADDSQFPELVKQGLKNPFSRNFDVAFRYLIHIAPDDEKMWLHAILSRNRNVFSVLSSTLLSVSIVVVLSIAADRPETLNNLGSEDARKCYRKLILSMQAEKFTYNMEPILWINAIGAKNYRAIEELQRTLGLNGMDFRERRNNEERSGDLSSIENFRGQFLECSAIEDPNMITGVSVPTVAIAASSVFLFVIILAFAYAWMVRDSIDNALNVVLLRAAAQEDAAQNGE